MLSAPHASMLETARRRARTPVGLLLGDQAASSDSDDGPGTGRMRFERAHPPRPSHGAQPAETAPPGRGAGGRECSREYLDSFGRTGGGARYARARSQPQRARFRHERSFQGGAD